MTSQVTDSLAFLLSKLGQATAERFADRLAPLGLRPRHCAVLQLLEAAPLGQLALARTIGVTPSVVVDMLDELEGVGAVRRVRDTADRRRQLVELTDEGRELSRSAAKAAAQVDADLLGGLSPDQRGALREALTAIATTHDLLPGG
ncbi:MarR family winged helix-turn-helix transcriptional regulator [Nonomuraea roseoviolacea]|uniref:DNA-binding MarR family transcriptional regulator n=1 Tax=Nonomuraea roseoviolacea subsp. carminata TaxID=160689 RepID=A0ABT1K0M0_9ACTN|nr:MarR family transcriptional regulator [Nonomuraea roseoviolacea]MCP2347553.1 DNA-binding MarR family transcriptional regulator [Nonomuraea roseoviolacea subsp. carminata]